MKPVLTMFLCLFASVLFCGCVAKAPSSTEYTPFETTELESVLAIVVDMSGSFQEDWKQDGRAHKLFLELIHQFFVEHMGTESKVIIGQISNSDSYILFDRPPQEFTTRFRRPEQLNQFLEENADASGSRVYQATGSMFDYVSNVKGLSDNTRILTVVLSDLVDSQDDDELWRTSGHEMLESLETYAKTGAGVALYFVDEDEKSRWRQIMKKAGLAQSRYVIEGELTESPQLPSFD